MKRVIKTAILAIAVAFMATSFSSCSEDETATPEQKTELRKRPGLAMDGWVRKATDPDQEISKKMRDIDGDNTPIIR